MKVLNALEAADVAAVTPPALAECFSILLRVLYPVCPHITQSLWQELGYEACCGELLNVAWADVDEKALVSDTVELVCKSTAKHAAASAPTKQLSKPPQPRAPMSRSTAKVAHPKKIIVVPGRLVNVVV